MSTRVFVLSLIIFLFCPWVACAEEYKTFIISGQSNAQGYGYANGEGVRKLLNPNTSLAETGRLDLLESNPEVLIFHGAVNSGDGRWKNLDATCGISWNGGRFGPELSFGHKIQNKLGGKVALIKYAKGGTSLADNC
ncbi:MAG TPA: sialate O-acetylesterase, partial [Pontiella sp.]